MAFTRCAFGSAGFFVAALVAVVLVPPATAQAQKAPAHMTTEALRAALVGRPLAGIYPDGVSWSERMQPDGGTLLDENGERLPGRWFFDRSGALCFAYGSSSVTDGCYRYVRLGANCYEHFYRDPQESEARWPDEWVTNGRLWRTDALADCPSAPSS